MKYLHGNTFPIKDKIKEAGGKFDWELKTWKVPNERYEELKALIPQRFEEANNGNFGCCADCQSSRRYIDRSGYCLDCKEKRESKGEDVNSFKLTGQVWEECPICDQEPIYLSHGVCECCARKGKKR